MTNSAYAANATHTRALAVDLPATDASPRRLVYSVQYIVHMARRPQTEPSGLSRERILGAALAIAGQEGVESLSMRRLAQELDVWPMSVYRYFQDKDALLDAMAAGAAGGVTPPSRRGSWRAQMTTLLDEAQRAIGASPGLAGRLPRAFLVPPG